MGWEDLYAVSSLGRIKALSRVINIFGRKPYIRPGCTMALHVNRNGHFYCDLTRDAKHHRRYVHQLVCQAWHGSKPSPDMCALHRNDIKSDNRPGNLYWGTTKDNFYDSMRNGRYRNALGQIC